MAKMLSIINFNEADLVGRAAAQTGYIPIFQVKITRHSSMRSKLSRKNGSATPELHHHLDELARTG